MSMRGLPRQTGRRICRPESEPVTAQCGDPTLPARSPTGTRPSGPLGPQPRGQVRWTHGEELRAPLSGQLRVRSGAGGLWPWEPLGVQGHWEQPPRGRIWSGGGGHQTEAWTSATGWPPASCRLGLSQMQAATPGGRSPSGRPSATRGCGQPRGSRSGAGAGALPGVRGQWVSGRQVRGPWPLGSLTLDSWETKGKGGPGPGEGVELPDPAGH